MQSETKQSETKQSETKQSETKQSESEKSGTSELYDILTKFVIERGQTPHQAETLVAEALKYNVPSGFDQSISTIVKGMLATHCDNKRRGVVVTTKVDEFSTDLLLTAGIRPYLNKIIRVLGLNVEKESFPTPWLFEFEYGQKSCGRDRHSHPHCNIVHCGDGYDCGFTNYEDTRTFTKPDDGCVMLILTPTKPTTEESATEEPTTEKSTTEESATEKPTPQRTGLPLIYPKKFRKFNNRSMNFEVKVHDKDGSVPRLSHRASSKKPRFVADVLVVATVCLSQEQLYDTANAYSQKALPRVKSAFGQQIHAKRREDVATTGIAEVLLKLVDGYLGF
jgi:hypothetical protein